jgi:hypothetical protein
MNTPRYCNNCSMQLPVSPPDNKCPSCGKPIGKPMTSQLPLLRPKDVIQPSVAWVN